MPPILIASVPIAASPGPGPWNNALPSSLSALPFQAVTLQQVISAGAPTVHVGDLDLSSTVFGSLSPSSLLFSNATLASLHLTPPPGCSSCTYVYDVELAGKSLSSLSLPGLTLVDNATALQGTLLGDMNIDQVDWSSTQGGWNLPLSAIQS
ncbi:MAG TPA: hypothetical protein VKK30_04660, partial [Actinomycetota bacterium]|nr:hypothetical protein [Actinomycetota bacterium]